MAETTPLVDFVTALAEFQAELPRIGKDQTANAGTYSYSYADLTTITEAAMPLLTKRGFSWTTRPTMTERGFVLKYNLNHAGGHELEGDYPLPDPGRTTPQQLGSAISYGRRYCLCAVTGIAPGGEDDDGAKASQAPAVTHRVVTTEQGLLADLDARVMLAKDTDALRAIYTDMASAHRESRLSDKDRNFIERAIQDAKDAMESVPA